MADRETHDIVEHEHLAIAVGPGADADRRYMQFLRDSRGEFARHGFQHHSKSSRSFHGARVALHVMSRIVRLALHVESAHRIHGLRRQSDVSHHGNFGFDEARDQFDAALSAFHLYGFRSAFFHKTHRVANRFLERDVVTAVRHVGDEQRAPGSASDGANMHALLRQA